MFSDMASTADIYNFIGIFNLHCTMRNKERYIRQA